MVTATVRRVSTRRTRGGKTMVQVVVEDDTGAPDGRLLQPALAGPAAGRRLGGRRLRADRDLPGRPPDDEPGRGPRRRPDGPPRARLPAVGQGEDRLDRDRRATSPRRCERTGQPGRGAAAQLARRARPGRAHGGLRGHPRPGDASRSASAPGAASPSTSCLRLQLVLVMKKRAAATQAPGIAHVVTLPPGTPGLVEEFLGRLPFRLTAAQERAIREVAGDLGASHPMHRLLQGDVGAGQDGRGAGDAPLRRPGRPPGRAHGPDRGARRAALPRRPGLPRRAAGRRPDPHRRSRGPSAVALLTNRTTAGERSRIQAELLAGEPRPGRGHPRPVDRRHPFPLARGGRDRRAAPFRGRAAGGAAGEGPRRRRRRRRRARTVRRPGRPRPSRVPGTPTCS